MGESVLDRSRRPPSGSAPVVQLPRFQRARLTNGLTLLTVDHGNIPEISARLVIPFGAAEEPPEKAGAGLLTARTLSEGTESRSARDVARALDTLGARFSVDVTQDSTLLRLGCLSRVFDSAMDILADLITQPAFKPKEVSRLRDERLDEIARGLDEPRVVANLRLNEAIFDGHPYGIREGGSEETVRDLTTDDLRDLHSRFYRPTRATLVLVGDLPPADQLVDRLETAFGSWQGEPAASAAVPDPEPLERRRIWAIDWSGPQSELRIGGLGIARASPDYPAVRVMNSILGGLFSSRINMNLREDKGWTYGARSRFDGRRKRGPFYVATAVDASHSVDALREMLNEMEGMTSVTASDEEMSLARNAVVLSMPRLFETAGQISARVAHQVTYGLPDDYWETYARAVRETTAEDVVNSARRYIRPDSLAAVVVGPVGSLASELEELGAVEFRDIRGQSIEA